MNRERQVLVAGRYVRYSDVHVEPEVESLSHFRHNQMQAHFWLQAESLGLFARVEAPLGGAGRADLLICRDLLAKEPLAVVEFKERLTSVAGVHVGLNQTRRYLSWIRKRVGYSLPAYLVAPEVPSWLLADFRWRDGWHGVQVIGAETLQSLIPDLSELTFAGRRERRPIIERAAS